LDKISKSSDTFADLRIRSPHGLFLGAVSMFARLSNGWQLAKQSFQVLRMDKELLLFPIMSGIACALVLATFAVPLWFSGYFQSLDPEQVDQLKQNPLVYVVTFLFYFANYFTIVFFNSALVACAVIRFHGGNPTVGDGLRAASARLPQIFGWALVAASVGMILKAIENRSEKVGALVAGLLGMGWTFVTFFVVPVIVIEKAGPVEAIKRSTSIIRKTWGESLAANFGIGGITMLLTLPAILLLMLGVAVAGSVNIWLGSALIAVAVVGIVAMSLISSALNAILLAALYLYAANNEVPDAFDAEQLTGAFARK
jgi:hypothetical protein